MSETPIMDDFFEAFGEDSYQSEITAEQEETTAEVTESESANGESSQEGDAGADGGEKAEGENTPEKEESPAEEGQKPQETFTLKVNKEERILSRDEVIAYAQKGMDYDRVKAAAEQAKTDNTALKEQNAEMQEGFALLKQLAEDAKMSMPELILSMRQNRYRSQGLSEDAAKERVAREEAEKALAAAKAEKPKPETTAERANREVAEFRKFYPDVPLEKDLMGKLMGDVQNGMSLTQAYQKLQSAEQSERIRQLTAELEAEKKNRQNKATSPGSQRDVGANRVADKYDEFFNSFN